MLDPISRAAIIAMSILCVGATVVLAPMRARSSDSQLRAQPVSALHAAPAPPDLWIARDPFVGEPARQITAPRTATPRGADDSAPSDGIVPLPSNLAVSAIPAIPPEVGAPATTSAIRVTAIVTGPHPYAMVEIGGTHVVEGIGDRIAGQSVTAIGIDGLTLGNGQHLYVADQTTPHVADQTAPR